MAPHSSTLAWKIPWMEEPGRLQSMGSLRVGHDWVTSLSLFTFMHWRRNWQPTPVFLPGESQGRVAWWAAVCGIAQSRTQLKGLSSSSSRNQKGFSSWALLWPSFSSKTVCFTDIHGLGPYGSSGFRRQNSRFVSLSFSLYLSLQTVFQLELN